MIRPCMLGAASGSTSGGGSGSVRDVQPAAPAVSPKLTMPSAIAAAKPRRGPTHSGNGSIETLSSGILVRKSSATEEPASRLQFALKSTDMQGHSNNTVAGHANPVGACDG